MSTLKWMLTALATMLMIAGQAQAQPWGYSGMSGMQSWVSNWADPDAYYVEIRYQGVAPQVETRLNGRMLNVSVRQVASGPGSFMTGGSTKHIPMPMDADLSRLWRHEEPGRSMLVIPRQPPPVGPRW